MVEVVEQGLNIGIGFVIGFRSSKMCKDRSCSCNTRDGKYIYPYLYVHVLRPCCAAASAVNRASCIEWHKKNVYL